MIWRLNRFSSVFVVENKCFDDDDGGDDCDDGDCDDGDVMLMSLGCPALYASLYAM